MSIRKRNTTIALVLSLTVAVLLGTHLGDSTVSSKTASTDPSLNPQEPTQINQRGYKCVQRTAEAKSPTKLGPLFQGRGKGATKEYYKPINLRPLCAANEVPVSVTTRAQRPSIPKGNPLLGHIRNEREFDRDKGAVIRRSLRPFKQVYWKGTFAEQKHHALLPTPQAPACDGVAWFGSCYYYGTAAFRRQADGGGMTMTVSRPAYVNTGTGGHTLDEIAIQGGPGDGHIVELGWNVSSDQYGDSNPHLFVFHWNNWVPTCYDGCGWQQYSSTYFPGMDLNNIVGREVYIGYVFFQGNWWAWFDNQWLGYFPGSEWGGNYTRNELIQWFGEVSSSNGVPPRTDMGNGNLPTVAAAARNSTLCDVDAAAWVCWYRDQQTLGSTVPADYDILRSSFGATRYGGPGE